MLNITKPREFKEVVSYEREFRYLDDSGAGFSFTVDEEGNILSPYPEARRNFAAWPRPGAWTSTPPVFWC